MSVQTKCFFKLICCLLTSCILASHDAVYYEKEKSHQDQEHLECLHAFVIKCLQVRILKYKPGLFAMYRRTLTCHIICIFTALDIFFPTGSVHTHTHAGIHTNICYVGVQAKCHYSYQKLKQFWTTRGSCLIAVPFKSLTHTFQCIHTRERATPPHPIYSPNPQNTLKQNLFIHPIILAPSLFERRWIGPLCCNLCTSAPRAHRPIFPPMLSP